MQTTSVAIAAQRLKDGHVLAYPTEAVWGLGCDPFNEHAFQKILVLKQRPIEKGVILLAGHIDQVRHLLDNLPQKIRDRIIQSWNTPSLGGRAITWLLPSDTHYIPTWITGEHSQVAVRVTTHPLCMALCKRFNGFIVSTSANPAGLKPALSLLESTNYFSTQIDYLNGELGLNKHPSQIIDAITGKIIR